MNFDDLRTDPPGSRPVAWFSWHADVPRTRHAGDPVAPAEPEASGAAPVEPASNGATSSIAPERVAALRRWIAEGGHNAPDVAEQVARRILDRGDL